MFGLARTDASRIKKFGVDLEETTLKPAIGPPKQTEV